MSDPMYGIYTRAEFSSKQLRELAELLTRARGVPAVPYNRFMSAFGIETEDYVVLSSVMLDLSSALDFALSRGAESAMDILGDAIEDMSKSGYRDDPTLPSQIAKFVCIQLLLRNAHRIEQRTRDETERAESGSRQYREPFTSALDDGGRY